MILSDKDNNNMVPKVFISSTFYDLKYVRENVGAFVENYGFTPIISETGNLGYAPLQSLDISCYNAMRASDMAILIIGGRYGSPSSDETMTEDNFKHYKSVTKTEFKTAVSNNVPTYVFIEAPVYYEYETYKKNKDKLEDGTLKMEFSSVDNINVFRFISDIYAIKGIPVWAFTKVEDIKDKLKKQWATLFLRLLLDIKSNASRKRLEDPINIIDSSVKQMNILLEKLGEKILSDSEKDIENIKTMQKVENAALAIANSFEFCVLSNNTEPKDFLEFFVDKLFEAQDNGILSCGLSDISSELTSFESHFEYEGVIITHYGEYLCYSLDVLSEVRKHKENLINRLLETDCLIKMKLN